MGGLNKETGVKKPFLVIFKLQGGKAGTTGESGEESACAESLKQEGELECGGAQHGRGRQGARPHEATLGSVQSRCGTVLSVLEAVESSKLGRGQPGLFEKASPTAK